MNEEELKLLDKIEELPKELNIEIRGLILSEVCLRKENQQLKEQLERNEKDNKELRDYLNFYECSSNRLFGENKKLNNKLKVSEKARKESMLILGEYRHYTLPTEEQNIENEEYCYLAQNPNERCRKDVFEEALSKYKEIIGDKDE